MIQVTADNVEACLKSVGFPAKNVALSNGRVLVDFQIAFCPASLTLLSRQVLEAELIRAVRRFGVGIVSDTSRETGIQFADPDNGVFAEPVFVCRDKSLFDEFPYVPVVASRFLIRTDPGRPQEDRKAGVWITANMADGSTIDMRVDDKEVMAQLIAVLQEAADRAWPA